MLYTKPRFFDTVEKLFLILFQPTIIRPQENTVAVKKKMNITKILVVLAAVAISLTAIGVAYGYYVSNQTRINTTSPYATDNDFGGWVGGCFGFRPDPYEYHYQYRSNSTILPDYVSPYQPYQPQTPNQGYYCGYKHGCLGWQTTFSFLFFLLHFDNAFSV